MEVMRYHRGRCRCAWLLTCAIAWNGNHRDVVYINYPGRIANPFIS